MKHRINVPQRGWSFPWETQTDARWTGTMAFPNPRPAIRGSTCYLLRPDASFSSNFQAVAAATLPMTPSFPRALRVVPPAPAAPSPPPARPTPGVSLQCLASLGSRLRTWRLGRPGPARWWPRLPVRSCRRPPSPKHLSGVACLAPNEQHYPIASRFTRRLGAGRA